MKGELHPILLRTACETEEGESVFYTIRTYRFFFFVRVFIRPTPRTDESRCGFVAKGRLSKPVEMKTRKKQQGVFRLVLVPQKTIVARSDFLHQEHTLHSTSYHVLQARHRCQGKNQPRGQRASSAENILSRKKKVQFFRIVSGTPESGVQ